MTIDVKIKHGWQDISLSQYQALVDIENGEYDDIVNKGAAMVGVVYGVDAMNIPYTDFQLLANTLTFFDQTITPAPTKAVYKVNEHKYWLLMDYTNFTTAQYVDYTNFAKNNDMIGMLSVVLVPEGHNYLDGYSIDDVRQDLGDIAVTDAMGVVSFFGKSSVICMKHLVRFLSKKLRKTMKDKKEKEMIKNRMKELEAMIGGLSHIYLPTAMSQTTPSKKQ